MSSSDAQPPLTRRQARERERAARGRAEPVTPPPTVAAEAEAQRRRPGSHVAPAAPTLSQSSSRPATPPASLPTTPVSSSGAPVSSAPPASATEIVPGSGGMTRRQLRALRAAQEHAAQPVPLQAPTPQSSDRTVADVLGSVQGLDADAPSTQGSGVDDALSNSVPSPAPTNRPLEQAPPAGPAGTASPTEEERQSTEQEPTGPEGIAEAVDADSDDPRSADVHELDAAAVEQATSADGSPNDIEPIDVAADRADAPPRRRSTWAPRIAEPEESAGVQRVEPPQDTTARPDALDFVPAVADDRAPGVFPLDLDEDEPTTNEVPIVRPVEPKPITTAFTPPSSNHWTQEQDSEVLDEATGTRRVADTRTNAIILPKSPKGDVTGALNATGEVILTGSIDLPKSLSSTGSHRPIDGAEIDRLLEQQDEQPETDASPVRASSAVSSHASTRQVVLAAAKPTQQSRAPIILAVSAASVGVAAAALFVVALFGVFNGN